MTSVVPRPDPDSAPYWAAAAEGRLVVQRCRACRALQFFPRPACTVCQGDDLDWEEASGQATVHSFTVVRRAPRPALADAVPYVVALVDLAEGVRMMTNIVDCPPDDVRIGMAVQVRFRVVGEGMALPVFAPA